MQSPPERVDARVSRETMARLSRYEALVRGENQSQNLVSRATLGDFFERHVADALQLLRFVADQAKTLADVGSGAGLPGMVLAIATNLDVILVEPRRLRAGFLARAAGELKLESRVRVVASPVERVSGKFDIVTARAVAPLTKMFSMTHHLSHARTVWILPKGRSAADELATARETWHGEFELVASVTDPAAHIVIARNVRRRKPA